MRDHYSHVLGSKVAIKENNLVQIHNNTAMSTFTKLSSLILQCMHGHIGDTTESLIIFFLNALDINFCYVLSR